MRSDIIDLILYLHHSTNKAALLSENGNSDDAVWVPLSQCEIAPKKGRIVEVSMPEWLATEKGLV